MSKKVITFGEIMLRLATPDYLRFCQANQFNATFGGGEANVAASLANYGIETEFVTRLPQNDIARACVMELRKQGIGTSKIIYGGERLGIYFLETGAVARASKVVYDRAHSSIAGGGGGPGGGGDRRVPSVYDRLCRCIQGCLLVSLDRYHASHIRRCRQRMLGSDTGGKPIGHHGILRPQLPEKSLEIR